MPNAEPNRPPAVIPMLITCYKPGVEDWALLGEHKAKSDKREERDSQHRAGSLPTKGNTEPSLSAGPGLLTSSCQN